MENKKEIAVSLVTVLLVISIIIIGVMGYFMYKLYTTNNSTIQELEGEKNQLQTKVTELEDERDKIQDQIDNIQKTIKENNLVDNSTYNPSSAGL